MADTMSIALVGALILTLTFVPVMCAYWFKREFTNARTSPSNGFSDKYAGRARVVPRSSEDHHGRGDPDFWLRRFCWSPSSAANSCRISTKARLDSRHDALHDLLRRGQQTFTAGTQYADEVSDGHRCWLRTGRPDDGTDPTGFFNDEFYVGLKPYGDSTWKTGPFTTRRN